MTSKRRPMTAQQFRCWKRPRSPARSVPPEHDREPEVNTADGVEHAARLALAATYKAEALDGGSRKDRPMGAGRTAGVPDQSNAR